MLRLNDITDERWRDVMRSLRRVALSRGAPVDDVDDVVQAALEKALRRAEALSDPERFEAWVRRIGANETVDRLRAARRAPLRAGVEAAAELPDAPDQDDALLSYSACVEPFLARLAAKDAEALRLKDLRGLRFEAVAEAIGLTTPGAKARVQRARRRLAEALAACCGRLRDMDVEPLARSCERPCCAAAVNPSSER